jgi:hypothetical protein
MFNQNILKSKIYGVVSLGLLSVTSILFVPSVLSSTKVVSVSKGDVVQTAAALPVKALDMGTFKDLDFRKPDGLTPDHIPSGAAVIRAITIRDQKLDPNSPETDKKIPASGRSSPVYLSANAIVYDTDLHASYSRTYLSRNNPAKIKADAADLKTAFKNDVDTIRPYLIKKYSGSDVDKAFKKLDDLNKASGLYK